MKFLTESEHYQVVHEYERVFLKDKKTSKLTNIGDFYGDPAVAAISKNEAYCVMGGCGVIIYYLTEPFEEYKYGIQSAQWREWGRTNQDYIMWIKDISCIDDKTVEIETEDNEKIIFSV